MRRRIAILVALVWAPTAAVTIFGQDRLPVSSFSKCSAIRLEMVLGRVMVVPLHRGQLRITSAPENASSFSESLIVNNDCATPSVRYEQSDDQHSVSVEVVNWRQVTVLCEEFNDASPQTLEFRQPEEGDVHLVIRQGDDRREVCVPSFWHLVLSEPRICQEKLVPILELLRPGWHLADMSERLEAELFHTALSEPRVSRDDLAVLVEQLGSPQFHSRQAADRQLRSLGLVVLPFLDTIAPHSLSGEQRARIRGIRQSLAAATIDSPDRTAQWLADDEQVWFGLLKHPDPQRRHLAAIRLAAMRSDTIQFDPYGDESYRQEQLAQLRLQNGYR